MNKNLRSRAIKYLGSEINLIRSSLTDVLHYLFKRMLERERLVDPNTVSERQEGPTDGPSVGEDRRNDLGVEGAEVFVRFRLKERKELAEGGTI